MKKKQWLILSISHQNFKIENSFCFKSLFKIPIEYQYVLPVLYIYKQIEAKVLQMYLYKYHSYIEVHYIYKFTFLIIKFNFITLNQGSSKFFT